MRVPTVRGVSKSQESDELDSAPRRSLPGMRRSKYPRSPGSACPPGEIKSRLLNVCAQGLSSSSSGWIYSAWPSTWQCLLLAARVHEIARELLLSL